MTLWGFDRIMWINGIFLHKNLFDLILCKIMRCVKLDFMYSGINKVCYLLLSQLNDQNYYYPITLLNLNIGKYIAISITPTITPTIIVSKGFNTLEITCD